MEKVLIAMSGGVDSAVAAFLCKKQGYACKGINMVMHPDAKEQDINDAKAITDLLDIPFEVYDCQESFRREVIDRFIWAYENGATPNPCIVCNKYIKFGLFLDKMYSLGYDYIATGHYAKIEHDGKRYILKKADDLTKDQSYVLYSLTQEQLSHTLFPLGTMSKEQTRKIADDNSLINAHKSDSQDICFVPDGKYAEFIKEHTGKTYPDGDFVDKIGNRLGTHKGIIKYTIGQRKGLGLALPAPMYVCEKDIENNRVILCSNDELFSDSLTANDFNWIAFDTPPKTLRANARIRYNQKEQPATVNVNDDGTVTIIFDKPQRAVSKGQAVVLYDGDIVLGGGTII